ncbi:hypothetical protein BRADI_2g27816v3 [Brachypodium distachyon]|uniref:Uncharacterized protein n=1 Tax=Brachypodium distachyon TaxID=15368 RepID=A0A0Q3G5Q2_BRADI|nr:hypothetical protein BRADI_2g27816v3 [Brachypodium distachyon]
MPQNDSFPILSGIAPHKVDLLPPPLDLSSLPPPPSDVPWSGAAPRSSPLHPAAHACVSAVFLGDTQTLSYLCDAACHRRRRPDTASLSFRCPLLPTPWPSTPPPTFSNPATPCCPKVWPPLLPPVRGLAAPSASGMSFSGREVLGNTRDLQFFVQARVTNLTMFKFRMTLSSMLGGGSYSEN